MRYSLQAPVVALLLVLWLPMLLASLRLILSSMVFCSLASCVQTPRTIQILTMMCPSLCLSRRSLLKSGVTMLLCLSPIGTHFSCAPLSRTSVSSMRFLSWKSTLSLTRCWQRQHRLPRKLMASKRACILQPSKRLCDTRNRSKNFLQSIPMLRITFKLFKVPIGHAQDMPVVL